ENDSVIGNDEVIRPDFTFLRCLRLEIGEFYFENGSPRHAGESCCDHPRAQRDFILLNLVAPFGSTERCSHRLAVWSVEKWICSLTGNGQQDRSDARRDLAG